MAINRYGGGAKTNENGLLFDPKDSAKMILDIVSVYNDEKLANRLAEQAYIDSKQYAVEEAVAFMANVYRDLI